MRRSPALYFRAPPSLGMNSGLPPLEFRGRFGESRRRFERNAASRSGKVATRLVVGLATVAAILGGAGWALRDRVFSQADEDILTHRATVGQFAHDVTDRGEVESSSNVDVICEVQSQNFDGVAIIEIVPEGSTVQEGQVIVKLDDASLLTNRATQQIAVNSAAALVSQAQNDLEAFIHAKKEYEFGTFVQDEEKLQSEAFVAEENYQRAVNYLEYSEKLASRGYVNPIQLKADRFAVEKAKKELDLAKTKLAVLVEYTKIKTLKKHEADIKTAEAKVKSEQTKYQIELDKLTTIEAQLAKCTIKAPKSGQVVYANENRRWRGDDSQVIRQGTKVRERQAIIHLPDPKLMQVKAKVNESRIDLIKTGLDAEIQLDALPGIKLHGRVNKVDQYPTDENWFSANVKEYATFIEILDPPEGLRPGMSAQVAIRVETLPAALQVPVQAVVERGGKHFCLVPGGQNGLEAREVLIGHTNEKFLVIKDGLLENEEVLLNPRVHLAKVQLPVEADDPATSEPTGEKDERVAIRPASEARAGK